jgi:sporulation protein YtfJ
MKDRVYTNKIEEVMNSAMNNLKSLVDIDVVVGKPIISNNAMTIIPLTKVTMGFVSGGGEYNADLKDKRDAEYPFSGGSGGGLSIKPIGFLVMKNKEIELVKIEAKSAIEKLIETVPDVAKFMSKNFGKNKKCENSK